MSEKTIYSDLKQLGSHASVPQKPEDAVLERVANPQAGTSGYRNRASRIIAAEGDRPISVVAEPCDPYYKGWRHGRVKAS